MAADPRADLARRIYERTGSRDDTISGMVNLGYGKAESRAAVDLIAPAPRATPPGPARTTTTDAGAGKGASTPPAPTPPAPPASDGSKGTGGKLLSVPQLPDVPRPSLRLPKRPTSRDVGSFGLGLLGFTLALQWFRYGAGGPSGWVKAKLFNVPFDPPGQGGADTETDADPGLVSTRPTPARVPA